MKWYLTPANVEFDGWNKVAMQKQIGLNISLPSAEPSAAILHDSFSILPLSDERPSLGEFQIITGRSVSVGEGSAEAVYTVGDMSLDGAKGAKHHDIESDLANAYAAGFSHDFSVYASAGVLFPDGTTGNAAAAGVQVLQTRDNTDRTNWLIQLDEIRDLIEAGNGSTQVTIRTMSNAMISLPATDAKTVLAAMRDDGKTKLGTSWLRKNALVQAETLEQIAAV